MHLVQEHRTRTQELCINLPVLSHPLGHVPDMKAQIQTAVCPLRHAATAGAQIGSNTQVL